MLTLRSCCCGCSLRTGTILSGIYTLVLSLLNCGLAVFGLWTLQLLARSTLDDIEQPDSLHYHIIVTSGWLYSIISVSALLAVASVILIIGVLMEVRWLLIPWIVVLVSTILLDVAVLIYDCAIFGMLSFNLVQMFLWLLSTLLNIYCLLCVFSFFRNFSTVILNSRQQSQGIVLYSTTIQQVHLAPGPLYVQCATEPSVMTTILATNGPSQGAGNNVQKPSLENGMTTHPSQEKCLL